MKAPGFWWREPGLAAALLSPIAGIYGAVAQRRLAQPGTRIGIPVICVGNPTVGGAGKTPAAIAIARLLIAAGEKPMFLTRGYGGRLAGPVLVEPTHIAAQVGDEPLLLARAAPTIVAAERIAGARLAKDSGASVIVMDDGFQNPSLVKDFSILVMDAVRGVGNGRVLPAGPLRAPLAPQFDRASAILITDANGGAQRIAARGAPVRLENMRRLPLFFGRIDPDSATSASLAGRRVLAFAGIGNPEKFFATLERAGIDAPVRRGFPDHHRYSAKDARALLREARQGGLDLLTTEKDLMRLKDDAAVAALSERARALPVTMDIADANALAQLIREACAKVR